MTLHHPSMHFDSDTDPKHNKSRQIRTHLDQSRTLFVSSFASQWMINNGMGRGSAWSSLDFGDSGERRVVGQVGWCHRQGTRVARQQCSSTCWGQRGDPGPRCNGGKQQLLTPEFLDEIREFVEEERGRISSKIVSIRFTSSRIAVEMFCLLRLRSLVICMCRTITSVIVATSLKRCWRGLRLHLEGVSRGRSQLVDDWIWT